jgi:hypothetical protein
MATLQSVARERKNVLKALNIKSRNLDAKQEVLEREIKRIINRKRAVPEVADMQRLINMADASAVALNDLVSAISSAASTFRV